MRKILLFFSVILFVCSASAQMADPVHFTSQLKELGNDEAEIVFTAKIDQGWHVYSTDLTGGPIAASFNVVKMDGVEKVGKLRPRGNEQKVFDKLFDMEVRYFEKAATFVQKIKFTKPEYTIDCYLEYGACNDEMCMPPSEVAFKKEGKSPIPVPSQQEGSEDNVKTDTVARVDLTENTDSINETAGTDSTLWAPTPLPQQGGDEGVSHGLLAIFLAGLLGGFIALLTPCVWPIIPMTVSFFLKRNKERSKAIREAIIYGLSIIVIYVALGLLVTALFGANALNALSTNAWFNIFFALLLIIFAASFFRAFELMASVKWERR
jgi:thiol:disulfide interchange protein DsbD